MPVAWTFTQTYVILLIGFGTLSFGFSRRQPIQEAFVLIFGAVYMVINTICWRFFLTTTALENSDEIFRFGMSPFLPAASFYLGIMALVGVLGAAISVLSKGSHYSPPQKWAFSASSLTFLIGICISVLTPVSFQRLLDSFVAAVYPLAERVAYQHC